MDLRVYSMHLRLQYSPDALPWLTRAMDEVALEDDPELHRVIEELYFGGRTYVDEDQLEELYIWNQRWSRTAPPIKEIGKRGRKMRTYRRAADAGEVDQDIFECQNCGHRAPYHDLPPAKDLLSRMEVGDVFTDVECPKCGALCYPAEDHAKSSSRQAAKDDLDLVVYFNLVAEDDVIEEYQPDADPLELEDGAIDELTSIFGKQIGNEGHDKYGSLICNMVVHSRDELSRIFNKIDGMSNTVGTSFYHIAENFTATEAPGRGPYIPIEDWEEVYGIRDRSKRNYR